MQHVTGIGGLFFRAKNPSAMGQWYKDNLGIDLVPADYSQKPWSQEAGPTVFAPFPDDSDYFGHADKNWMINFRVRELDVMVDQLRAAKIAVSVDPEIYPNGRFARLHDPEGNPIELWEPKRKWLTNRMQRSPRLRLGFHRKMNENLSENHFFHRF